jgi:hypothetical protein
VSSFQCTPDIYGFTWGPATIERSCSDDKWGVLLTIRTPRGSQKIRVTPTGFVRVGKFSKEGRTARRER